MGKYTAFFEEKATDIFEEDDYIDELRCVMGSFRSFGEALDSFIVEHGFTGDVGSLTEKVRFISDKCSSAGVPVPRNLTRWYTEGKRIERASAVPFQLCFAFGLNECEADDFLRRICLSRGFDCHVMDEVVYYYALKNGMSYSQAEALLSGMTVVKPGRMTDEDLVYTNLIAADIESIETPGELVNYLNENAAKFSYNNATACESIRALWRDIAGDDEKEGIAANERRRLYSSFDMEEEARSAYESRNSRRIRKRSETSIWEIYLQMLGLSGNYVAGLYGARSLKSILRDNELINPLAADAFPDRDGLNKILGGEHVSYERVRKLMIFLLFYRYFAGNAIKSGSYAATEDDGRRCISVINSNLVDANYPRLYAGNPYDFLILMASASEQPLCTFREYMRELFYEKTDLDSLYCK